MNLRVTRQHLRVRLTTGELDALLRGEGLLETLTLPDATQLRFRLNATRETAAIRFAEGCLDIEACTRELGELRDRLPSRDGIRLTFGIPDDAPLRIDIEVDVREPHRDKTGKSGKSGRNGRNGTS